MKTIITIFSLCFAFTLHAQEFGKYFENKTLRLDYIFSGNANVQEISLDDCIEYPKWDGRMHRLSELPLKGNGVIEVRDQATNDLIYTNSFSSLFQEWLDSDEAKQTRRAFENTFLVPMPKKKVLVNIRLFNTKQVEIASFIHNVNPRDILIAKKGYEKITPYRIIHKGKVPNPINVAILAEGYTAGELTRFYKDAQMAVESILTHEPFRSQNGKFEFLAVGSTSLDSGITIPHKNDWRITAFGSHFDTFYSERYLTTRNVKAVHNALAGIPYEHIIILANTAQYGGGGIYNSYTLTTTRHPDFAPVVVHEFGHSFAGLADEYFYEGDVLSDIYALDIEPWEQNITTRVNFKSKWQDMLKKDTPVPTAPHDKDKYAVGVYEGGGYASKGIFRPAYDCRMRTNQHPEFCPVCQRAIKRLIEFYTND